MHDITPPQAGRWDRWIRGARERTVAHRNIGFFARYAFGTEPFVTAGH